MWLNLLEGTHESMILRSTEYSVGRGLRSAVGVEAYAIKAYKFPRGSSHVERAGLMLSWMSIVNGVESCEA